MKIKEIPEAVVNTEVSTVTGFFSWAWHLALTILKYFIAIYLIIVVVMFFTGKL